MAAGAGTVAGAQAAQPGAELRVVVDGLEVERGDELPLGGREPTGPEVRAAPMPRAPSPWPARGRAHAPARSPPRARCRPSAGACLRRRRCMRRSGRKLSCVSPPWRISGLPVVQPNRIPEHPRNPEQPVADFSPFAGVRYQGAAAELAALVAPPYDVIDDDQRADARGHRRAQLRSLDPPAATRPSRAIAMPVPPTRSLAGCRRACSAARPGTTPLRVPHGVHRPARRPSPHPRRDRRAHAARARRRRRAPPRAHAAEGEVRSARAAAGDARERRPDLGSHPRLGTHRRSSPMRRPLASCVDPDGVRHEIAAIDDPQTASPRSAHVVAGAPLVLADGHHRFETALNYRNELRADGDRSRWRGRDHGLRRRARRRRAVHRADPPFDRRARRHRPPGPPRRRVRRARRGPESSRRRRRAAASSCAREHGLGLVDGPGARARRTSGRHARRRARR